MQWFETRLVICGLVLGVGLGLGSCASDGSAPNSMVASPPSAADVQLAGAVQEALHADPYLYDRHIEVSIEHGNVVLRGFVSSSWDLVSAKKIASKAAGARHVVDNLSIKPIQEEQDTGSRR